MTGAETSASSLMARVRQKCFNMPDLICVAAYRLQKEKRKKKEKKKLCTVEKSATYRKMVAP